jgi:hypothetical protein
MPIRHNILDQFWSPFVFLILLLLAIVLCFFQQSLCNYYPPHLSPDFDFDFMLVGFAPRPRLF